MHIYYILNNSLYRYFTKYSNSSVNGPRILTLDNHELDLSSEALDVALCWWVRYYLTSIYVFETVITGCWNFFSITEVSQSCSQLFLIIRRCRRD